MLNHMMLSDQKKILRRTYFWNLAANLIYSIQSAILLMVVTRSGSLADAGVFSIIYATTHMLSSIGNYNMRNFQVSDALNEYSFREYWTSRVISCGLMLIIGAAYGFINYHDWRNISIVLFFVGYRITDGIEDVIHGLVQKEGRLDIASFARTWRIILASIAFVIAYIITKDLFFASLLLLTTSLIAMIVFLIPVKKSFSSLKFETYIGGKVWKLLLACFPICLSALLQNYIVNSPKYAIDSVLSSETQGIFNILFMPIFAINVLSMFIFNPLVANMGKWWVDGELEKFRKSIWKQVFLVGGITLIAAAGSYLCGCELLGLIYGVELREYKVFLMTLMIFGGMAALATYFSVIITIMRKQNLIIIAYAVATIISVFVSVPIVQSNGMSGAAILYGIVMLSVVLILATGIIFKLRKTVNTAQ